MTEPNDETPRSGRKRAILLLLCAMLAMVILALVFPAVCPRANDARDTEVSVEITQFEQALKTFKAKYGAYPPSMITLSENGQDWLPGDAANIRRLWPQFDFEHQRDWNQDGDTDDVHILNGAECLVFFLGGLRGKNGKLTGISSHPLLPFAHSGQHRNGPLFEFDAERLTDVDDDSFYEYVDGLNRNRIPPAPFVYVVRQSGGHFSREGLAVYADNDSRNLRQPYELRAHSLEYQIISPGDDGEYGVGGEYDAGHTEFIGDRQAEADNLTNFASGRLGSH